MRDIKSMNALRPKRAVEFRVVIEADTLRDVANTPFDLSNRVAGADLSQHSVSGGYNSGYEHWLSVSDRPTHDEYVELLDAYLTTKRYV